MCFCTPFLRIFTKMNMHRNAEIVIFHKKNVDMTSIFLEILLYLQREIFIAKKEDIMENEFQEYVTFCVTAKDGTEVEMAVVDEFDLEEQHYVVGALVEGDTINDDGWYIYRSMIDGDDFAVEKIETEEEYDKIAQAYLEMSE